MTANPELLRLVHDTSGAVVTATGPLVHQCPHVPETDVGTVTVRWKCRDTTLELHSLTAYLASWADQAVSSEEVTEQIRADLDTLDGIDVEHVSTTWRTAGLAVHITADPQPVQIGAPPAGRCLHGRRWDEGCGPCGDQP